MMFHKSYIWTATVRPINQELLLGYDHYHIIYSSSSFVDSQWISKSLKTAAKRTGRISTSGI